MTADCHVSWLRLEQHALAELAGPARAEVEAHLASCADCRARMDAIRGDSRPLPALPALGTHSALAALPGLPASAPPRRRTLAWMPALALAAVALFLLYRPTAGSRFPGPEVQVKGGTLAIAVLRERDGTVTRDPATWADGDRIQVRVTCPPGDAVEVAVVSDGSLAFPLGTPACGNDVVAGALRLTGDGATAICAVEGIGRDELLARGPLALGDGAACAVLTAIRTGP